MSQRQSWDPNKAMQIAISWANNLWANTKALRRGCPNARLLRSKVTLWLEPQLESIGHITVVGKRAEIVARIKAFIAVRDFLFGHVIRTQRKFWWRRRMMDGWRTSAAEERKQRNNQSHSKVSEGNDSTSNIWFLLDFSSLKDFLTQLLPHCWRKQRTTFKFGFEKLWTSQWNNVCRNNKTPHQPKNTKVCPGRRDERLVLVDLMSVLYE